jgi:energy-converting hydrogenase Eha subunit G
VSIGTIFAFKPVDDTPAVYMIMLISMGVVLGFASGVGAIVSLGYAIYKFVGRISQKFPALEKVWNQLCPVQTVHLQ